MRKVEERILTFRGVDAAGILFGLGKYPKALAILEKVLARNPLNKDALLLKATVLSHLGHRRAAFSAVGKVLAEDPEDYEGLLTKAGILSLSDKSHEALALFARLATRKQAPRGDRRYLYSAWLNALIGARRWRSATRVVNEAIRLFPGDKDFRLVKARLAKWRRSA